MKHKYLECDFYWVEIDEDGDKVIHPYGFIYDAEESVYEDKPDLTYRFDTFYDDFTFLPEEFEDEDFDYNTLACDNLSGYTTDINKKEADRLLKNSLDIETVKPIELQINKVTEDTPCGWYVNYPYPVYRKF